MSFSPTSNNPANLDSLTGTFNLIMQKFSENWEGMLPARVIGYSAGPPPRVSVQPLISTVTTAGGIVSKAQIASLPVLIIGGGGFVIHFPLNVGDLGWILSADRDLANFLDTYEESTPNTARKHDFSSAIFIPDVMKGYNIASEDSGAIVIQSLSGNVKVSLTTSTATVSAPTVNIISGNVNLGSLGGAGVARIGDSVDPDTHIITGGSSTVFSG